VSTVVEITAAKRRCGHCHTIPGVFTAWPENVTMLVPCPKCGRMVVYVDGVRQDVSFYAAALNGGGT
jgi:ribosomal protein S27E